MEKGNVVLFPIRNKRQQSYIQFCLQKTFSKKQSLYLSTLMHSVPDADGWLRITQQEIQKITRLRPETQKRYRLFFCKAGILRSKRVVNYQGRVYVRFNPNFFTKFQKVLDQGVL